MTILLLRPYATYAQGATVDLDNATEASLVAQGLATYTVNPGPNFQPLTAAEQQAIRDGSPPLTAAELAAVRSGSTRRPVQLLRVAVVGDSLADVGSLKIGASRTLSATTDQRQLSATLADAVVAGFQISLNQWGLYQFYPAARLVANCGISGQTTTQLLARSVSAESTTRRAIDDMLAFTPDVAIVRIGINDIYLFTTATSQATIDAVHDRNVDIVYRLVSLGIPVLWEGMLGYDATSGTPPAAADLAFVRSTLVALNARAEAAFAAIDPSMCRVLNTAGVTHDGTGAFIPGMTGTNDGTHIGVYGMRVLAAVEASVLQAWFGPSTKSQYQGANLLTAPGSVNSRAGFPATLATAGVPFGFASSVLGTANGVAISGAAITNRNNRRWWTINASAATAATAPVVAMRLSGFNSAATYPIAITGGQTYGFEFDFFIETQDGSPIPPGTGYLAKVLMTDGTNTLTYFNLATRTTSGLSSNGTSSIWTGHMVFNPIVISEGSATLTASSILSFETAMTFPGTALRIGIAGVNIVQL